MVSQEEPENLTIDVDPRYLEIPENQHPPNLMGGVAQVMHGIEQDTMDIGCMLVRVAENPSCVMNNEKQDYLLRSMGIL